MTNVKLLRDTLAHIEAHPETWDQRMWIEPAEKRLDPSCGTAHCFAGWAVALSGYVISKDSTVVLDTLPPEVQQRINPHETELRDGVRVIAVSEVAAALLDVPSWLTSRESHLFDAGNDLDDLRKWVAEYCDETEVSA